jgi:hypothetical protein|tara:strand:+ start:6132 stop:6245 length:114 start_codon:yes stop_codon:yes gene_type:complete
MAISNETFEYFRKKEKKRIRKEKIKLIEKQIKLLKKQ